MDINYLLLKFSLEKQMEPLSLNNKGYCQFEAIKDVNIQFQAERDLKTIYLYVNVLPYPEKKRDEVFATLLHANFLGQGTNGAAFAVRRKEKQIVLARTLKMSKINYKIFKLSIEDAIYQTVNWRKQIAKVISYGAVRSEDDRDYFWKKI